MVDIPEMVPLAFSVISHYAPEATILLPNEHNGVPLDRQEADVVFLCPDQTHLIPSNGVDLAVNTSSFQEMTYPVIAQYFDLIYRAVGHQGLFYCLNEVACKKIKGQSIEFEQYPWNRSFKSVLDSEYAYMRLIGEARHWQRLQEINK